MQRLAVVAVGLSVLLGCGESAAVQGIGELIEEIEDLQAETVEVLRTVAAEAEVDLEEMPDNAPAKTLAALALETVETAAKAHEELLEKLGEVRRDGNSPRHGSATTRFADRSVGARCGADPGWSRSAGVETPRSAAGPPSPTAGSPESHDRQPRLSTSRSRSKSSRLQRFPGFSSVRSRYSDLPCPRGNGRWLPARNSSWYARSWRPVRSDDLRPRAPIEPTAFASPCPRTAHTRS